MNLEGAPETLKFLKYLRNLRNFINNQFSKVFIENLDFSVKKNVDVDSLCIITVFELGALKQRY